MLLYFPVYRLSCQFFDRLKMKTKKNISKTNYKTTFIVNKFYNFIIAFLQQTNSKFSRNNPCKEELKAEAWQGYVAPRGKQQFCKNSRYIK